MKKFLCVLISVILALASALFISCGKETNTDQSQTDQTEQTGQTSDSTDTAGDDTQKDVETGKDETTGKDTTGGDADDNTGDDNDDGTDDSDDSSWDTEGAKFSQMSAKEKYNYIFNGSFNANIKVTDVYDGDVYTRVNEYSAKLTGKRVYATKTEKGDEDEADITTENYLFSVKKGKNIANFIKNEQIYNTTSGTQTETNIYCICQNRQITLNDLLSVMTYGRFSFQSEYLSTANEITLTANPTNENILTYSFAIPEKPTDTSTNEEKESYYKAYCDNFIVTSITADFSEDNPKITIVYSHIAAAGGWNDAHTTYSLSFMTPQSQSTYVSTIEMTFSDVGNVKTIDYPESTAKYNSLYDGSTTYLASSIETSEYKMCMAYATLTDLPDGLITLPSSVMIGEDEYHICAVTMPEIASGKVVNIILPECATYGIKTAKDSTETGTINAYYLGTEFDDDYFNGYAYGTLYLYSDTEPTKDGNYWHYDTDGKTPVAWDAVSGVDFDEVNNIIYVWEVKDTTAKAVYIPLQNGSTNVGGIAGGIFANCAQLTKIYFEGTLEQWNALEKNTPYGLRNETTVICSDGEITLDADYTDVLPDGGGIAGDSSLANV